MVERFFNGLNVIGGIRAAILFVVIAVAAMIAGGWQGWLIGLVFLLLAVYAVVPPLAAEAAEVPTARDLARSAGPVFRNDP